MLVTVPLNAVQSVGFAYPQSNNVCNDLACHSEQLTNEPLLMMLTVTNVYDVLLWLA